MPLSLATTDSTNYSEHHPADTEPKPKPKPSAVMMSLSDLVGELSQALNQTEQALVQAKDSDSAAQTKLDSLTSDSQKLERTVQELLDQVEFIKNSDIRGEDLLCRPLEAVLWSQSVSQFLMIITVICFSVCPLRGVGQRQEVLPAVAGSRSSGQRLHHGRRQPRGDLGHSAAAHRGQDEPDQGGVPEQTRRARSETGRPGRRAADAGPV